jgi:hypothetical protein
MILLVRFEAFTAVTMKNVVFWDMATSQKTTFFMILLINGPASVGGEICNPVTVYPEPACN